MKLIVFVLSALTENGGCYNLQIFMTTKVVYNQLIKHVKLIQDECYSSKTLPLPGRLSWVVNAGQIRVDNLYGFLQGSYPANYFYQKGSKR